MSTGRSDDERKISPMAAVGLLAAMLATILGFLFGITALVKWVF